MDNKILVEKRVNYIFSLNGWLIIIENVLVWVNEEIGEQFFLLVMVECL